MAFSKELYRNILSTEFFDREEVVQIARELIGKGLYSTIGGQLTGGRIVETEAYRAPDDRACHAHGNRRTARTETMFAAPGTSYVYLCYGIHKMLNVVTAPAGTAHAILIRAIEPTVGIETMRARRNFPKREADLTNGPGKVGQALGLQLTHNALDLTRSGSPVWLAEEGMEPAAEQIVSGPRVGVAYAGSCALRPWRFRLAGNRFAGRQEPEYGVGK